MVDLDSPSAGKHQPHYVVVDQLNTTQWKAYAPDPSWPTSGATNWVNAVRCGLILTNALGLGLLSRSLAGEVLVLVKPRAYVEARS